MGDNKLQEVSAITAEQLSRLEWNRLEFAQSLHQDLSNDKMTTRKMVYKYSTLFANMQELIQQLLMDGLLKGFYRREFFSTQVQRVMNESAALKEKFPKYRGSVVCMIDYDNFKLANDTHGHEFGDKVLKAVAAIIKKHVHRQSDILGRSSKNEDDPGKGLGHTTGRHGGDEIAILLFDTDIKGATNVTQRIQKEVDELKIKAPDGSFWHQTVSIGVADILPTDKHTSDVFQRADEAAYTAKRLGKNQVVVWQPPLQAEVLPLPQELIS